MTKSRPVLSLKTRKKAKRSEPDPGSSADGADGADGDDGEKTAGLLRELRAIAPELWDPAAPAPLAVGVHKQMYPLIERIGISRRFLRDFLRSWTRSDAYRLALVEPGAWRYNVDGSAAAPVSPSEAEQAREQVERRADS